MRILLKCLSALFFVSALSPAFAFEMILPTDAGSGTVSGDARVESKEQWPATLVFTFKVGGGLMMCSSTIVGPRAMLTAAHCVADDATGTLRVGSTRTQVTCQAHPEYNKTSGKQMDIALCESDADITVPYRGKAETISTLRSQTAVGSGIHLLGYGCRVTPGDNSSTILYGGDTVIDSLDRADIITTDKVTVCPGDSGGAAYRIFTGNSRRVVAINSRVGLNSDGTFSKRSMLTNLSNPKISGFIGTWLNRTGLKICGVNLDAATCRQ